ncbi:hypothetical protein AERO9AM_10899 [Aeromicrobium sp. 9AM]|nr:hypothetical protein AERO9AM_10899 [Aeromicrobium sp. 9AM]
MAHVCRSWFVSPPVDGDLAPAVATHSLPGDQDRSRIQLSRHTETGARIPLPKKWLLPV